MRPIEQVVYIKGNEPSLQHEPGTNRYYIPFPETWRTISGRRLTMGVRSINYRQGYPDNEQTSALVNTDDLDYYNYGFSWKVALIDPQGRLVPDSLKEPFVYDVRYGFRQAKYSNSGFLNMEVYGLQTQLSGQIEKWNTWLKQRGVTDEQLVANWEWVFNDGVYELQGYEQEGRYIPHFFDFYDYNWFDPAQYYSLRDFVEMRVASSVLKTDNRTYIAPSIALEDPNLPAFSRNRGRIPQTVSWVQRLEFLFHPTTKSSTLERTDLTFEMSADGIYTDEFDVRLFYNQLVAEWNVFYNKVKERLSIIQFVDEYVWSLKYNDANTKATITRLCKHNLAKYIISLEQPIVSGLPSDCYTITYDPFTGSEVIELDLAKLNGKPFIEPTQPWDSVPETKATPTPAPALKASFLNNIGNWIVDAATSTATSITASPIWNNALMDYLRRHKRDFSTITEAALVASLLSPSPVTPRQLLTSTAISTALTLGGIPLYEKVAKRVGMSKRFGLKADVGLKNQTGRTFSNETFSWNNTTNQTDTRLEREAKKSQSLVNGITRFLDGLNETANKSGEASPAEFEITNTTVNNTHIIELKPKETPVVGSYPDFRNWVNAPEDADTPLRNLTISTVPYEHENGDEVQGLTITFQDDLPDGTVEVEQPLDLPAANNDGLESPLVEVIQPVTSPIPTSRTSATIPRMVRPNQRRYNEPGYVPGFFSTSSSYNSSETVSGHEVITFQNSAPSILVSASFVSQTKDQYLGFTDSEYCPMKTYDITSGEERFWIELWTSDGKYPYELNRDGSEFITIELQLAASC